MSIFRGARRDQKIQLSCCKGGRGAALNTLRNSPVNSEAKRDHERSEGGKKPHQTLNSDNKFRDNISKMQGYVCKEAEQELPAIFVVPRSQFDAERGGKISPTLNVDVLQN